MNRNERPTGVRDLARTALGFTWAMSLLGLQQARALARPSRWAEEAEETLADLTRAAEQRLDGKIQSAFTTGDNLQRRAIDWLFRASWLENLDPSRLWRCRKKADR